MEFLLAAAVGGIVTQGVKYAWSYINTSSSSQPVISSTDVKIQEMISRQQQIKSETNREIKNTVSEIERQNIPLSASQFLTQIQQRRNSLRHVEPVKKERQKTDLEILIERRRHSISITY